mmetsp:Transcript_20825/g.23182  ORF Transcript_20825/g.23182 Transcript_20825/m.23182 type:complete len:603 (-) Transcript_20825:264-2072(-)
MSESDLPVVTTPPMRPRSDKWQRGRTRDFIYNTSRPTEPNARPTRVRGESIGIARRDSASARPHVSESIPIDSSRTRIRSSVVTATSPPQRRGVMSIPPLSHANSAAFLLRSPPPLRFASPKLARSQGAIQMSPQRAKTKSAPISVTGSVKEGYTISYFGQEPRMAVSGPEETMSPLLKKKQNNKLMQQVEKYLGVLKGRLSIKFQDKNDLIQELTTLREENKNILLELSNRANRTLIMRYRDLAKVKQLRAESRVRLAEASIEAISSKVANVNAIITAWRSGKPKPNIQIYPHFYVSVKDICKKHDEYRKAHYSLRCLNIQVKLVHRQYVLVAARVTPMRSQRTRSKVLKSILAASPPMSESRPHCPEAYNLQMDFDQFIFDSAYPEGKQLKFLFGQLETSIASVQPQEIISFLEGMVNTIISDHSIATEEFERVYLYLERSVFPKIQNQLLKITCIDTVDFDEHNEMFLKGQAHLRAQPVSSYGIPSVLENPPELFASAIDTLSYLSYQTCPCDIAYVMADALDKIATVAQDKEGPLGADVLFPIVLFCLTQSETLCLQETLFIVKNFSSSAECRGPLGYSVATVDAAASHIKVALDEAT